jgi:hypothetical protein
MECTESSGGRRVHRSFFADFVEQVKGYQQTPAYQKALNKRKVWVEPLFAEGKQWHGMGRFRLRRLWRVNCEALVIASGQNLKRLLQKRGWGDVPFLHRLWLSRLLQTGIRSVFEAHLEERQPTQRRYSIADRLPHRE